MRLRPVREVEGEVEILLHQDDRHLALVAQLADHPPDQLDDVGLDALGRLVHQQDARPGDERARDGKLLLLPARQVAAAAVLHLLQDREQLEDPVGHRCSDFGRQAKPVSRFSRTVSSGKIMRPCGT
jgi:hypothetical protein